MDTRAGIALYENVLRYAEVQRHGSRYRMLRLGSCEFDFDVAEALRAGTSSANVEALTDALIDIFDGSVADRLYVALHPPVCYSFFAPLPVEGNDETRKERLLRDAALLTRTQTSPALRLTADAVYTETLDDGESVEWFHVLALHEQLHIHFDRIVRLLPHTHHRMTLSMHAVANAIERIERGGEDGQRRQDAPFTLALGWYPTHVELTLCRHSRWYFSHFTEAGPPSDCGYFTVALLRRLGLTPGIVGRVFIYGGYHDHHSFASLTDVLRPTPEPLNPLQLFDLDADSMAARSTLDAYGPCLGVVL